MAGEAASSPSEAAGRETPFRVAEPGNRAGNLVGLEIGPVVREKPSLAQDILRTVQAAQAKLADAVQTGVPSIAGTETMGELVGRLRAEYPELEPEGYVEGGFDDAVTTWAKRSVCGGKRTASTNRRT